MTRPPPLELFASERPVRSDYARERSYARRRLITVVVLISVICGIIYALMGHGPSNPADIPTIKAEGSYKQKPTDPGGINIPHQDVRVYDQLESKNDPGVPIEHLLPPPETPKDVPHVSESQTPAAPAPLADPTPTRVTAAPVASVVAVASIPPPAPATTPIPVSAPISQSPSPAPAQKVVDLLPTSPVKTIATTVTPYGPSSNSAQQAATVAVSRAVTLPKDQSVSESGGLSIEQVIANTKAMAPQPPPVAAAPTQGQATLSGIPAGASTVISTGTSAATSAPTSDNGSPVSIAAASVPSAVPMPPPIAASIAPSAPSVPGASSGGTVIQLASVPDETKAHSMMADLQNRYASQLGSATLQLVQANLGSRGVFYRIQSQSLSESDAAHICSSLKQMNAGCILVRK